VGFVGVLVILSIFTTGCSKSDPYNPSNFIDYSKPRFSWFDKDKPNATISNSTTFTKTKFVQQIPEGRDYWIGTFNIETFGATKAENTPVYEAILNIIRQYDIIAIQEIRDNSGTVAAHLGNISGYRLEMSDRLGRSISKEQYAFLWTGRVVPGVSRQYPDSNDKFERPPFMMDFTLDDYHFVIITVHTKPEDAQEEIKALPEVVDWARTQYQLDDIFIMGDLNMDCTYFNKFNLAFTNYTLLINEKADTTVSKTTNCAYDRIVATRINDNILSSGVDNEEAATDGDETLQSAISDHWPVYWTYKKAEINTTIEN